MDKTNIPSFTVDEVSNQLDPYAIRNFIVSDVERKIPSQFLGYPHSLKGIAVSICVKGVANVRIDMREYEIRPNKVLVLLPDHIIEPMQKTDDFMMESLFFSFDFISELPLPSDFRILEKIEQSPCVEVSKEAASNLLKYHEFIVEQYNKKEHQYRQEIAKYLLFALIAEIGSIYSDVEKESKSTNRQEKIVNQFYTLLRRHYREERGVAFYADKICITAKYLASLVKKMTGKSILAWINDAVILTAKVMLKSSDLTVTQIADDLNFIDASSFCRFFKKYAKMTPAQYRESGTKVRI